MAGFVFADLLSLGGDYCISRRCDYAPRQRDRHDRAEREDEEGEELPLKNMCVSYWQNKNIGVDGGSTYLLII